MNNRQWLLTTLQEHKKRIKEQDDDINSLESQLDELRLNEKIFKIEVNDVN
jgi:hypothetical protein